MKKLLSLLAICLWVNAQAQIPELIYYQYNSSGTGVVNHALTPVGANPALVQGALGFAANGFQNSLALDGKASVSGANRINTGWNTKIDGSFTLAFYTSNIPVSNRLNYLFGDQQASEFRCFTNGVAGAGNWLVRGGQLPDLPVIGGAAMSGKMIHIVYDSTAATYTSYVNGVQNTQVQVDSVPNIIGSGLIIAGYLNNTGLNGLIDEFRWYSRALDQAEITRTWNIDLNILGNCTPFTSLSIDTLTADAALISWSPGNGNTGYFLEYGPEGFSRGTGLRVLGSYPNDPPQVLLSSLQPKTKYEFYFGEFCNAGDSAYLPSPVTFTTTRLCPAPSQLQTAGSTTNSIPVFWTAAPTAVGQTIIYGFGGFNPKLGGSAVNVIGNSFTIANLSPATGYDIYLASTCSAGQGGSDTVGPLRVSTLCAPITAFPYLETFEPKLPHAPAQLPHCWQLTSTNDLTWYVNSGTTLSASTGPEVDKTTDSLSGHYVYLETSLPGTTAEIITPEFDISQLTTPIVSFWYHMFGNSTGSLQLQVSVNGGQSWVTISDLQGEQHWGSEDAWKNMVVDISTFISANTQFRFVGNRGASFTGDIAIDDFTIENGPSCLVPAAFFLSATDTSATFNLIGGANSYAVEWGTSGFVPGTGCSAAIVNSVFTLTNSTDPNCLAVFSGNQLIDVYLWNECDANTKVKLTIKTNCSRYLAPYSNAFDFDQLYEAPACWSNRFSGQSQLGGAAEVYNFGGSFSGPNSARLYNGNGSIGDTAMLITPRFTDLTGLDKQIRFTAKSSIKGTQLLIGSVSGIGSSAVFSVVDTLILDDNYQNFVVSLNNSSRYNGSDEFIALMHGQNESYSNIYLDDFFYENKPACSAPDISSLEVSDLGIQNARLKWGINGQGKATRVEWSVPGFVPGSGQAIGAASISGGQISFHITGLVANTNYEAYIRDSCDFDRLSKWVGPVGFTTSCNPALAPLTESFDNPNWQAGVTSSEGDAFASCWTRSPEADGDYKWGVFNSYTPSVNTGPAKDFSGNGNYIYTEASNGNAGDTAILRSPWIDISTLTRPSLEFMTHRLGISMPDLVVEVRDLSSAWDSLLIVSSSTQLLETDPFEQSAARLLNLGDTVQFRFVAISKGCCAGDLAIDEVRIIDAPSCSAITGLNAISTSDTSAIIQWDTTSQSISYQVWIGKSGNFSNGQPSAGNRLYTNQASLNLDTLASEACFQVSVRAVCAAGDTSAWTAPEDFCTLCAPILAPQVQDFNLLSVGQTTGLGNCWSTGNSNNVVYGWQANSGSTTSGNTGPLDDADSKGGKYLYTEASVGSMGDEAWIRSSRVDLSSLSSPELRFSYHMYGIDIDTLHVDVRDDRGWHTDVIRINGAQQFYNTDPWLDTNLSLSTYRGPVQIQFRTYRGNGFRGDLALDNIIIADPITCPAPTNLDTAQITANSAQLKWNGGAAGTYQVAYGKALASTKNAQFAVVYANQMALTGLDGGSQYGFFVRKICGIGDTSTWAGPFYFYTQCVPVVSAPYYANFEGLGNSSVASFSNCWSSNNPQTLRWESTVATGVNQNTVSTGPFFDNTVYPAPLGTYMFLESSLNGVYAELISPSINANGLTNPELVYHYHMFGQDINRLEVYLEASLTGSRFLVDTLVGQKQLGGITPFWERRIDLSSFPISTYRIVFKAYKGASYKGDIAIDDVWVDEAGANTCIKPVAIAVGSLGCDSIGVTWASSASAAVIEYGPSGFAVGTGTTVASLSGLATLRGLAPATAYDLRIANICGTDTSDFVRRNNVVTLNAPQTIASISYSDSMFASKNHAAKYFNFDASASTNARSYYWDFGNGQTSTSPQVMTFFVYNKVYDVMLVTENGCGTDTAWVKVNVDINLEETPLGKSLELYPNPSDGIVNLRFNTLEDGKAQIRLSDVSGQEVMSIKEENINGWYNSQINVSKLPPGIYLLEIDDGAYLTSRKLIKTN